MFWGEPDATLAAGGHYQPSDRWDTLASEVGREVYRLCPRWVFLVQGVGECRVDPDPTAPGIPPPCELPSAPGHQDQSLQAGTWWGENLQSAAAFPVDVGERRPAIKKIVYSPHTYGPATHQQKQFDSQTFPSNMPKIWDTQWAHLARDNIAPVLIGEFGGKCTGLDSTLQRSLVSFMRQRSLGGLWWALNPESGDPGGLITDWQTVAPERPKLDILKSLPVTRVPRTRERQEGGIQPAHDGGPTDTSPQSGMHASTPVNISPLPPPPPPPPPPSPTAIALEIVRVVGDEQHYFVWPPPSPSPPPSLYGDQQALGGMSQLPPSSYGDQQSLGGKSQLPPATEEVSTPPAFLWPALTILGLLLMVALGGLKLLRALDNRAARRLSQDEERAGTLRKSTHGHARPKTKRPGRPRSSPASASWHCVAADDDHDAAFQASAEHDPNGNATGAERARATSPTSGIMAAMRAAEAANAAALRIHVSGTTDADGVYKDYAD